MSPPRLPLAALMATAVTAVGSTAPAAPVGADDQLIEHCVTTALTAEEVSAGAVNEIECWYEDDYTPVNMRGSILLAVHWEGPDGIGSALDVYRTSCTGAKLNVNGTAWDDRISSTTHVSCGNVKHYTGTYNGSNQLTTGTFGDIRNMNGTLNNAVGSADYAP